MLRAIARSLTVSGSSATSDSPRKRKMRAGKKSGFVAADAPAADTNTVIAVTDTDTGAGAQAQGGIDTTTASPGARRDTNLNSMPASHYNNPSSLHTQTLPSIDITQADTQQPTTSDDNIEKPTSAIPVVSQPNTHALSKHQSNAQPNLDNPAGDSELGHPAKQQHHLVVLSSQSSVRHCTVDNNLAGVTTTVQSPPHLLQTWQLNGNDSNPAMLRKVWVKRPGASATRVEVGADDLVDNVRDVILHKYANSLGKSIDSPDITLKIVSREQANKNVPSERVLSPEEGISRTLDTYYPGGQTIEEALLIEVPQRRTPKASPRPGNHQIHYYTTDDYRPGDGAREYFPPMPLHSPRSTHVQHQPMANGTLPVHSMAVLTTGQVPPLPSPGSHSTRRHVRPKYGRQHTSSPTILHSAQSSHPNGVDTKSQLNGVVPSAPPLPTPPISADHKGSNQPPNRTTSPHPIRNKKKKQPSASEMNGEPQLPLKPASAGLLDGRVPPINVLIVEDNVINLRLLEQFMRRLKVRWKTAMNGREAVNVWRTGGFHLVLMDIQLPIMNGLEATKEIRRLEVVNGIGLSVFGETSPGGQINGKAQLQEGDKLVDRSLFKSPVIIVALTASSLQSDRHEALAVGCNDFLTKPVNFGWMERKVTEWGCMQALIDFDGWRKWKEIEAQKNNMDPEKRKQEEKEEKAKAKAAMKAAFQRPPPTATAPKKEKDEKETSTSTNSSKESLTSPNGNERELVVGTGRDRKIHKNSRSSGSIGTMLPSTMEVDEKGE